MKYHLIAYQSSIGAVKDLVGYNLPRMIKYALRLRNEGWLAEIIGVKI